MSNADKPSKVEMKIARHDIEKLVYGSASVHRYTQDSPILADVWIAYGEKLGQPLELILTSRFGSDAADVAQQLRAQIAGRSTRGLKKPRIAHNQVYIAATLYFDDVIRNVLPITQWWIDLWQSVFEFANRSASKPEGAGSDAASSSAGSVDAAVNDAASSAKPTTNIERPATVEKLIQLVRKDVLLDMKDLRKLDAATSPTHSLPRTRPRGLPQDLAWLLRLIGNIALAKPKLVSDDEPVLAKAVDVLWGVAMPAAKESQQSEEDSPALVWLVNLNRAVSPAVSRSRLAVKADAAQRLFNVDTRHLAWAIIDTGIDASHPAFFAGDPATAQKRQEEWQLHTRVAATYDFTGIRDLLDLDVMAMAPSKMPAHVRSRVAGLQQGGLDDIRRSLRCGRTIDWGLFRPLLKVAHDDNYRPPDNGHGTHVAGILAANMPDEDVVGMCPDIRLYDLRVLGPNSSNDEFSVLAALQFVNWLNAQKDFFAIHGVNLSLSIKHDVANFACGRTPICDQCEDLVAAGVVVVAAAGNDGYLRYRTGDGANEIVTEGYHTVSISDPGNARTVITVGSTHRDSPHTYGVSYFSSRGPTGDGRSKPDIVAPGEKINSVVPGGGQKRLDGTSMAAPHVSGACAMLMARHAELIGQPQRIKDAICSTAIDLGRERYFQGAGMLDVLRALQSI